MPLDTRKTAEKIDAISEAISELLNKELAIFEADSIKDASDDEIEHHTFQELTNGEITYTVTEDELSHTHRINLGALPDEHVQPFLAYLQGKLLERGYCHVGYDPVEESTHIMYDKWIRRRLSDESGYRIDNTIE